MLKIRKLIWRRKKTKRLSECLQSNLGLKLTENSKRKKSSQSWDQYTEPTAAGKRQKQKEINAEESKIPTSVHV